METTMIWLLLTVCVKHGLSAEPQPEVTPVPINLTCESKDWKHLTCKWCPEVIHSHITWNFNYYYSYGERKFKSYSCTDVVNCECHICGTDCAHKDFGRWFKRTAKYTITVTQSSGGKSSNYTETIDPRSVVKLSEVRDLRRTRVTSDNITVQWKPLSDWKNMKPPVEYQVRINLRELGNPKRYGVGTTTSHTFTGLRPYTDYEIGVRAKYKGSIYLGDPAVIVVRTAESAPEVAPTVYSGSFRITEDGAFERKIRFYWKNIPQKKSNGNLVNCTVSFKVSEGGHSASTGNQQTTDCSHETMESDILANQSYEVQLRAYTRVGPSPAATWFIPILVPPYPLNAYAETIDNSTVKIKWQEPNAISTPLSFTIYQCHHTMDDENSCLNMTVTKVSRNQTWAIIKGHTESARYTISTEHNSSSSGMMPRWLCVFSREHGPTEIKFEVLKSESPEDIILSWKPFEQTCDVSAPRGLPEYIDIRWCQTANCQATADNVRIKEKVLSYKISKVKPFTNYTISLTAGGNGIKGKTTEKFFLTEKADDPFPDWLVPVLAVSLLSACVGLALLFRKCWRSLKAWYKFPKPEIVELDFDLEDVASNVYTHAAEYQCDNCSRGTLNITAPYYKLIGKGDLGTTCTTNVSLDTSAHGAGDSANTLLSSAGVDSSTSAVDVSGALVTGNNIDIESGGRSEVTNDSPNHGDLVYDINSGVSDQQEYKPTKLYFKMEESLGESLNVTPPNGPDVRENAVRTNGSDGYESTGVKYMYMGGDYINTISQRE